MNQFQLLATRRFLPLFITQFMGAFNDNVYKNALVILITYRIADRFAINSQLLVTLAAALFIFPFFILSATAGQLADKYEKSRLIAIIKSVEILIMLFACIGLYWQNLLMLMALLFLLGVQATFFGPLKYAILPDHLKKEELVAGNALIEAGTFLSILLGTILGGLLILLPKGNGLISITIIAVAISGFLSSLFIPNTQHENKQQPVEVNIMKATYDIIVYSSRSRDILFTIFAISWFWLVGAIFLSEFPLFTRDDLHANQTVVTFFFALFSISIGVGSLLCNRLVQSHIRINYVCWGAFGMTIFMIDLYFAATHYHSSSTLPLLSLIQFLHTVGGWRMTIDLLLIGMSGGLYAVPLYVMLQTLSEEGHRARVIASNNIINAFFMVIAALLTILMLKIGWSVSRVFLSVALVNAVVAIWTLVKPLPTVT